MKQEAHAPGNYMASRRMIRGVYYRVEEQGEGDVLLLLHGFSGSSRSWLPLLPLWTRQFRVVMVDLLGHGLSDAPLEPARYAIEEAAADLEGLLHMLEATPAHVLGYSMGGRLALYLAVTRPQLLRSLVLESASPGLATVPEREQRRASDEQLADWIEAHDIGDFAERWEQLPLFESQRRLATETLATLRQQRLDNRIQGLANSLRGMGTGAQPSLWPRLGELALPVLLLAGTLDQKFKTINQQMAALIPGAQLLLVEDAGHTIHLEKPAQMAAAVTGFLVNAQQRASTSQEDVRG